MHRTNRDNAVRSKNLEETLVDYTKTHGRIDLLCGGWPCQDNSIAGKRAGHKGKRSGLWNEFKRLIGIFLPKWVIAENVPGLFSVNGGKDFWQVIADLNSLGYCVAWDVLDSQNFGVAQRRKRVFIIGSFGNIGAAKVLFEQESGSRNDKKKQKMGARGLCLSTRDGERQDPTNETLVAHTVGTTAFTGATGSRSRNIIGSTTRANNHDTAGNTKPNNIVAHTLGATPRGNTSFVWQDSHIAEINPSRERKVAGISNKLDPVRGVVIGNAVTVSVAEWIGQRILKYSGKKGG